MSKPQPAAASAPAASAPKAPAPIAQAAPLSPAHAVAKALGRSVALIQPQFGEAAYKRNVWFAHVPHGVSLKEVEKPEFWANVAASLGPRDRIECYAEDGSYYAEFIVVAVPEKTATRPVNWAKVQLLRFCDLSKDDDTPLVRPLPTGFQAAWLNETQKWGVRRISDSQVLIEKQASEHAAITAFHTLSKSMSAA